MDLWVILVLWCSVLHHDLWVFLVLWCSVLHHGPVCHPGPVVQAQECMDQLLRDWDPRSKQAFDGAVEASLGAAAALLEEATAAYKVGCSECCCLQGGLL